MGKLIEFAVSGETAKYLGIAQVYDIAKALTYGLSWSYVKGFTCHHHADDSGEWVTVIVLLDGDGNDDTIVQ